MKRRSFFPFAGAPAALLAQQPALQRAARGMGPLKITSVETLLIRTRLGEPKVEMPPVGAATGGLGLMNRLDHASPTRASATQAVLVKITTDQGLAGWGECHAPSAPRVHQAVIRDQFSPVLLGQDARQVEPLWERLYSTERVRGYSTGSYTEALAGVDLALWDILGKYAGLPLYQLLGGSYRKRIPTYASLGGRTPDELRANAAKLAADGFQAVKMGLSKGAGTNDLARVAAASEAMRGKGQVMVDSLGGYKLYDAVKVGRELDRLGNIGWWEDALLPEDLEGFAKLADALDTPLCAGEELCNRFQFRDLLKAKAADIINPDLCRAGGITETRRIAALADVHGAMWSPHISTGTALYVAASMHLAAATPNLLISEGGGALAGPLGNRLLKEPMSFGGGYIDVPERPGIGVEFDPQALAAVTDR
jgi:D-arabinonate dehydratase/D-galactarolactone cycloisomerase